jgi:hypothetical protein
MGLLWAGKLDFPVLTSGMMPEAAGVDLSVPFAGQLIGALRRQHWVELYKAPGEPMLSLRPSTLVVCFILSLLHFSLAQTQSGSGTAPQPGYTIQTGARVVLTDVTVTDERGNPVHGLPVSAFQVFDNKKRQKIESFEEHAGRSGSALAWFLVWGFQQ